MPVFSAKTESYYGTGSVAYLSVPYVYEEAGRSRAITQIVKQSSGVWSTMPYKERYWTSLARMLSSGVQVSHIAVVSSGTTTEVPSETVEKPVPSLPERVEVTPVKEPEVIVHKQDNFMLAEAIIGAALIGVAVDVFLERKPRRRKKW